MTTRTMSIRPLTWPLLLLTCWLAPRAHAQRASPADGMDVLLFREQALVTRTRLLSCRPAPPSGRIVVRFDRLPAAADRHSVRAQGRGAVVAGVRLIEIDGQSEASAALAARLAALDRQIAVARDARNRLRLRDLELTSYQSTVTDLVERQLRLGTVDPPAGSEPTPPSIAADAPRPLPGRTRTRRWPGWRPSAPGSSRRARQTRPPTGSPTR